MIDTESKRPIKISAEGTAYPYLRVPVDQLDRVRDLLTQNQIDFWVDRYAIALEGKPATAFVNLGRTVDTAHVQAILDDIH